MSQNRHAELAGVGEIRQPHAPRLRGLAENDIAFGAMQGSPVPNPPLQRPAHPVIGKAVWVQHLQVAKQCYRLHRRLPLKDWHKHR